MQVNAPAHTHAKMVTTGQHYYSCMTVNSSLKIKGKLLIRYEDGENTFLKPVYLRSWILKFGLTMQFNRW